MFFKLTREKFVCKILSQFILIIAFKLKDLTITRTPEFEELNIL